MILYVQFVLNGSDVELVLVVATIATLNRQPSVTDADMELQYFLTLNLGPAFGANLTMYVHSILLPFVLACFLVR